MDIAKLGLLTTLLLGIFILIGSTVALIFKRHEKVVEASIGLAFGVIIMLIATELLPEIIHHLGLKHIYLFIIFTAVGFYVLKILDNYIPDHDDEHMTKQERKENLIHIGVMTAIALALHNIIEGMAVYSTIITDSNMGISLLIGIGFHNIPLGMVITSALYQGKDNIYKTILSVLAISSTTFIGGLIMYFLNITAINTIVLGILLSITLGMLLFITANELIPRIKGTTNKKTTIISIIIGVVIVLVAAITSPHHH